MRTVAFFKGERSTPTPNGKPEGNPNEARSAQTRDASPEGARPENTTPGATPPQAARQEPANEESDSCVSPFSLVEGLPTTQRTPTGRQRRARATSPQEIAAQAQASTFFVGVDAEWSGTDWRYRSSATAIAFNRRWLLTAAHVIDNARSVVVEVPGRGMVRASRWYSDPRLDIGVIELAHDAPPFTVGPTPAIGTTVFAYGSRNGFTSGVVSDVDVNITTDGRRDEPSMNFIQTDAEFHPGTSGGGLFDDQGRLVGIVSKNFARTSTARPNMSFAVPATVAVVAARQLIARQGQIPPTRWPWGSYSVTDVNVLPQNIIENHGWGGITYGVRVNSVSREGSLHVDDIVVAIDGYPIRESGSFSSRINLYLPGERARIRIFRNRRYRNITVRFLPVE